MPFLQLSFETGSVDPDLLESACFEAGALSVTLTDAADTPILEPDLGTTPLWPNVKAAVLFDAGANRDAIVRALRQALGAGSLDGHAFAEIADRVWEREWLADFKPMPFGRKLWICPHGQEVPDGNATVVWLDPGLAFGTGTHPTTAMCLHWLDSAELSGKEILDYGCGSGILAIAAVKLGADRVLAVDHDPQALTATRDNATQNAVEQRIEALAPGASLPTVDILLANILALPLVELAPLFQTLVKPAGDIVLSGILAEQTEQVLAAYRPWFDIAVTERKEDWVCLHGTRR